MLNRFSSGDVVVDRRLEWAEASAAMGEFSEACDLLEEAMQRAPMWVAGWFRLGEFAVAGGDKPRAVMAFDRAIELDPKDRFGAGIERDKLRRVRVVESLPAAFVETLFDQYAPKFEEKLRGALNYQGPEVIRDAILRSGRSRFDRMLDLGCGTGLAAEALAPFCDQMTGYDLSGEMLKRAEAKGLYARLERQDLNRLVAEPAGYDLIVGSDVFNYLGTLERIVGWCASALRPGGVLAFSVEAGTQDVCLHDTNRFTHSRPYLTELLGLAGFTGVSIEQTVLRQDRGADVASLVVVAMAAPQMRRQSDGEEELVGA